MNLKQQAIELSQIQSFNIDDLNISNKDRKTFLKYKEKITEAILKEANKKETSYVYITGVCGFERFLHKFFTGFNYNVAMLLKEYFESEGFYVGMINPNNLYLCILWRW